MRPSAQILLVCAALVLAGCAAKGQQDPFAYTRKPLYTGHFDLDPLAGGKVDSQQFRVEDGSIAEIRVQVWVNATAGGALVEILDPSGRTVVSTTTHAEQRFPLNLGIWTVKVRGQPDEAGQVAGGVGILVTRG